MMSSSLGEQGVRFRNLQELRLLFAVSVVIAHAIQLGGYSDWYILRKVFSSEIAVQGFFILSGFLVYGSFERSPDLMLYFRRRVLRIFPAYVFAVCLFLTLVLAQFQLINEKLPPLDAVIKYLAANLSLLNFLQPGLPGIFSNNLYPEINGALWTIKVEVMFYLAVPLLRATSKIVGFLPMILSMILVGLLWRPGLDLFSHSGASLPAMLGHQLPGQLHLFGLGILLYGITRNRVSWQVAVMWVAVMGAVGLAVGVGGTVVKVGILLGVILALTRLPAVSHPLSHKDISYGVYLSHFPMVQMAIAWGAMPENGLLFALVAVAASMLYGLFSWHVIESPVLTWGNREVRAGVDDKARSSANSVGPRIGIDLHNIRDGGGVNYITNLLAVADPKRHGFSELHVFAAPSWAGALSGNPAVIHHPVVELDRGLMWRVAYSALGLPLALRRAQCQVLFAPGGVVVNGFRPYVTISRNMMPFSSEHWTLYTAWADRTRLRLLRRIHRHTFSGASAMIYLTSNARRVIEPLLFRTNPKRGVNVVPHGVDHSLFRPLPSPLRGCPLDPNEPVELIYCSRLEPYKHQLEVIEAVAALRPRYPNLRMTFAGWANPSYETQVRLAMERNDPEGVIFRYIGAVPNAELPALYAKSHLLVFASGCENMPNTLLEAMASGLPVISSSADPMPEIGGDDCLYFDPRNPSEISACIDEALSNYEETQRRANSAMSSAEAYDWKRCADATFTVIVGAVRPSPRRSKL